MSEALDAFLELQRRLRVEKGKGEDVRLSEVVKLDISMRQAFEKLTETEKESLRLQRRVTHIEGDPDDKTFAGFTSVVEVFVMQRQSNGELSGIRLPGDLMMKLLTAMHSAIRAVGEDFAEQDVCRRLLADDPRVETENLVFQFNLSQGLLGTGR